MKNKKVSLSEYADILYCPHHRSTVHSSMPLQERAAQFSPFAALKGFDEIAAKEALLAEKKILLSEPGRQKTDEPEY